MNQPNQLDPFQLGAAATLIIANEGITQIKRPTD